MEFIPIKTRPLLPPKDDIFQVFDTYVSNVQENDIIFITSKIIAIHQWRCREKTETTKKDLIKEEADKRIISDVVPWKDIYLTIKDNILIPSAGIDESNANGYYILRPNRLSSISKEIYNYFQKKYNITNLWIIITDSTTRPLKWWVVGIGIYSYGIFPILDKRGDKDIFWKKLEITQINVIDALSPMAVYLMWEWAECTPIVIWRNIPGITYTQEDSYKTCTIPPEEDLYKDFLTPLMNKIW